MNLHDRTTTWTAAVALGFACLFGGGAASVLAAPTHPEASSFELTLELTVTGIDAGDYLDSLTSEGTFRSRAPFCETGTFADQFDGARNVWRLTCDDGTGSLTVSARPGYEMGNAPTSYSTWRIVDGTGSYVDFRGRGSMLVDRPDGFENVPPGSLTWRRTWRSTLEGVVDRDAVAPTIDLASARATKLHRPAGAYSIKLALALADNVAGNPVSYTLRVINARGKTELGSKSGTATTPNVPMTLRIQPHNASLRFVGLQLTAEDAVGNVSLLSRTLQLPR